MNASERVVIFTQVTALPGKRDELAAAFADLHDAVALEPGCEMFIMHAARDEPDILLFYEVFDDQAALEAHQQSDAVRAIGSRMGELVAAPTQVTYATILRAKGA